MPLKCHLAPVNSAVVFRQLLDNAWPLCNGHEMKLKIAAAPCRTPGCSTCAPRAPSSELMWALREDLSLLLSCPRPCLASARPLLSSLRHVGRMLEDAVGCWDVLGGCWGMLGCCWRFWGKVEDAGGCWRLPSCPSWPLAQRVFCPSLAKVQCHRSLSLMWGLMPPPLLPDLCRWSWAQHWGFAEEQVQVTHPSVNPTLCLAGQAAHALTLLAPPHLGTALCPLQTGHSSALLGVFSPLGKILGSF